MCDFEQSQSRFCGYSSRFSFSGFMWDPVFQPKVLSKYSVHELTPIISRYQISIGWLNSFTFVIADSLQYMYI